MKYGIYTISLSIGYSQARQEAEIKISDYHSKQDWEEMTEPEQSAWMGETVENMLCDYINYEWDLRD